MSEFLAEARIIVRPDTSRFRRDLEAQLKSVVAKPIRVPVIPVVGGGFATAAAGTAAFAASQQALSVATIGSTAALEAATTITAQYSGVVDLSTFVVRKNAAETALLAAAHEAETIAALKAAAAETKLNQTRAQVLKGVIAQGAATLGLRAGTLAASSAFIAATVGVLGFVKAVQSAAQLETELNVFRVTAGATADEMDRTAAAAKRLGRDITLPGVTASTAATAFTELAKAGLSVQDSLAGARGALQLSTAAQIDVKTAVELVAGALNSFALAGTDAVKVADLLTGAAKESQGEISDMGTALAQASAVSNAFGVSIGDTVTLLTQLAKAGIAGGRAGTSLRVAFLRLVNPPADAAKALEKLNVQIRDSQGRLRPQIFTDIAKALESYTKAQRDATLATIFGSDAIRTAAIIGSQGQQAFLNTRDAVNEYGLAAQQAGARTQGLQGDIENFKNQISSLGLEVGEVASGPVGLFVRKATDLVEIMNLAASTTATAGNAVASFGRSVLGAIPFLDQFADAMNKVNTLLFPLVGPVLFGADLAKSFGLGADKIVTDAARVRNAIGEIVAEGQATGGDLGLNETLTKLDLLTEQLNAGGPEAQRFAASVSAVRNELQKFGTSGFRIFPANIKTLFPTELLRGTLADAKAAGQKTKQTFRDELLKDDPLGGINPEVFVPFTEAIVGAALSAAEKVKLVTAGIIKNAATQLAALDEELDIASISGVKTNELGVLQKKSEEQKKIVAAQDKLAKEIGSGNAGFETAVKKRREAVAKLASIISQIRSIEGQIASDQDQAAAKRKSKADKAISDFLGGLGLARTQKENEVAAAALTTGLKDDIKRQQELKALVVRQIAAVRDRISVEQGRPEVLAALDAILNQVKGALQNLTRQQKEVQDAQRQNLLKSIGFDIEFAQITDNENAEIAAREKLIAQLKKQQELVKRGTLEYKSLRNAIAQENAAIAELKKEKEKGQSFAQASFEFLQAQQGFASNLLGNLIPSGATGGLVGGGSVPSALAPVAGFSDSQSKSGPTSGQAQTTNAKLQQILDQLKYLNGGNVAPEARWQNDKQRSVMDY